MSGVMPGLLEGEERAGAAAAHLDVVDDQQHVAALAQVGEGAQPLRAGDVDAALALDRLDDHRGGLVEAGALVLQQPLEPQEVRHLAVEVVVERHRGAVHQRDAGAGPLHRVAGDGERAERHAVEGVGEGDDRLAALDLAGQLQRGLDGVGAGRAGEHDLVVQVARPQDDVLEALQEGALGGGGHVQAVGDAVTLQVVEQRAFEHRVVVAVVERAGAGEEVEVGVAVLVVHAAALRAVEDGGPAAAVAADLRLQGLEDAQFGRGDGHGACSWEGVAEGEGGAGGAGVVRGGATRAVRRVGRAALRWRQAERADAVQHLGVVPVGEQGAGEEHLALDRRAVPLGEGGEQPVGGGVVRGDGGLDRSDARSAATRPARPSSMAAASAAPALRVVDRHLPDDQRLRAARGGCIR